MRMFDTTQKRLYESWARDVFKARSLTVADVGKGFRGVSKDVFDYIDHEIGFANLDKDTWILVLNDFDLTLTLNLNARGYYNIIMLSTDLSEGEWANRYFLDVKYEDRRFKTLFPAGWTNVWKDIWTLEKITKHKINAKGKELSSTYEDYIIKGDTLKVKFGLIISNPPYDLGNEITRTLINSAMSADTKFVNIMPVSKYKKGNLSQHIIPGTIQNHTRAREASDFEGADTYPVICQLSRVPTNTLQFKDFEYQYCCNREEGLGKKFFEEQDRRITAEKNGTRPKAFVSHLCIIHEKDYPRIDVATAVSTAHWTPCIAHGWGAQEIYSDVATHTLKTSDVKGGNYVDWNFRKTTKNYTDVFTVTPTGINQTVTIMNSAMGKDNILKWMHSAERNGKYRHCGLFTILLRWMNKTTGCPYSYIIPRVDWDSHTWTDEEILRDYGYTDEEIETVLHYNDDLIPDRWKKAQEVQDETN